MVGFESKEKKIYCNYRLKIYLIFVILKIQTPKCLNLNNQWLGTWNEPANINSLINQHIVLPGQNFQTGSKVNFI